MGPIVSCLQCTGTSSACCFWLPLRTSRRGGVPKCHFVTKIFDACVLCNDAGHVIRLVFLVLLFYGLESHLKTCVAFAKLR